MTVTLGGTPVAFPHSAFLQPTREGQEVLIAAMREAVGEARIVADLFAGLGTFTLALADDQKVYAAEGARDAIGALKLAANHSTRQIFCEHRDLFRRPLSAEELNRFDGRSGRWASFYGRPMSRLSPASAATSETPPAPLESPKR